MTQVMKAQYEGVTQAAWAEKERRNIELLRLTQVFVPASDTQLHHHQTVVICKQGLTCKGLSK